MELEKITNVKSDSQSLSNIAIQEFCKKFSLPYHLLDLSNLVESNTTVTQSFVHTGAKKNHVNNGNNNHWLYFISPNYLFDSYGTKNDDYHLNDYTILPVEQLQSYDTVVCGEYTLSFNWYLNEVYLKNFELEEEKDFQNLVKSYVNHFKFTKNTKSNDEIVRKWYNEKISQ